MARRLEASLQGQTSLIPADPQVDALVERVRQRRGAGGKAIPPRGTPSPARATLAVDTERVTVEAAREAGSVHVGHQMWQ
ncbi:MAG: hypothetical protein ACRD2G_08835, partial [Terriglobia bacterium]